MRDITVPIDQNNRTNHIGWAPTRGNVVFVDEFFTRDGSTIPEVAKWIRAGLGGDLVVEDMDGNFVPFLNLADREWVPGVWKRVVSQHTFANYGLVTTTASALVWYGGI